jgi:hypothetical protein
LTSGPSLVHIHYRQPPRRLETFHQLLPMDSPEVKVTLAQGVSFDPPIRILGEVALEEGVWPPGVVGEWTRERALQRSSGTIQAPQRRPTSR